jgi:hypothetical protein
MSLFNAHRPNRFAPTPAAAGRSRRLEAAERVCAAVEAAQASAGAYLEQADTELLDAINDAMFDWQRARSEERGC